MENEDLLISQIDEFREKAKQLQVLLAAKESKAAELQSLVDERAGKAQELEHILTERQEEADKIVATLKILLEEIEAGKVELEHKVFSLRGLGDRLYDMFAKQLQARGIRYEVNLEDMTVDSVVGDELRGLGGMASA